MARTPAAKRWSDLIDHQEASGLTIRAFAEKADVNRTSTPYPSSPHAIADHSAYQRVLAVADFL